MSPNSEPASRRFRKLLGQGYIIRVSPKAETTNLLPFLLLNSNATFKQKNVQKFRISEFSRNCKTFSLFTWFPVFVYLLLVRIFLKSRMSRGCEGLPVSKYNTSKLFVDFQSAVFGARKLSLMIEYYVQQHTI